MEHFDLTCVAFLLALYSEYRLWYVPTDITTFARELVLFMKVALGFSSKVSDVLLVFLDFIEATN